MLEIVLEVNHTQQILNRSQSTWGLSTKGVRHRTNTLDSAQFFACPCISLRKPHSALFFVLFSLSHERAEPQFFWCALLSIIPLRQTDSDGCVDPFADEGDPLGSNKDVGSQQNYIHIRIQQRNGRKTLTTLQGLPKGLLILCCY